MRPVCGIKFSTSNTQKIYCSPKCSKKGRPRNRCRDIEHALEISKPVSNEHVMAADSKPKNTSDIRWRMELRRRANPYRYAYV